MPRKKRYSKAVERELTTEEYMEMLIGHGEVEGSAFETPFIKRAAWNLHREELLAACGEGVRPEAFWQFEHPAMQDAGDEKRIEYLRNHGLLEAWEEAKIKAAAIRTEVENGDRDSSPIE